MKSLSHGSWLLHRDLNPWPPENEAVVLTILLRLALCRKLLGQRVHASVSWLVSHTATEYLPMCLIRAH